MAIGMEQKYANICRYSDVYEKSKKRLKISAQMNFIVVSFRDIMAENILLCDV